MHYVMGSPGTGKTHLAQALGHQACRQGKSVRFIRASVLLREMHASRADQSWERNLKKLSIPDLLIIDDFGLSALTLTHAEDFYELVGGSTQVPSKVCSRALSAFVYKAYRGGEFS